VKAGEDFACTLGLPLEHLQLSCNLLLDEFRERAKYCLIGVDMAEQLLAFSMVLGRSKCEEVGSTINVKNSIEVGPFKSTSCPVYFSQSCKAVEGSLIGPGAHD
jgi:hypothetical protein